MTDFNGRRLLSDETVSAINDKTTFEKLFDEFVDGKITQAVFIERLQGEARVAELDLVVEEVVPNSEGDDSL